MACCYDNVVVVQCRDEDILRSRSRRAYDKDSAAFARWRSVPRGGGECVAPSLSQPTHDDPESVPGVSGRLFSGVRKSSHSHQDHWESTALLGVKAKGLLAHVKSSESGTT